MAVLLKPAGIIRFFSFGERLTQSSFSGTVREAKKYLTALSASWRKASPETLSVPVSKIKSKRRGSWALMTMPLRITGVYAPVIPIIWPGKGKLWMNAPWPKLTPGFKIREAAKMDDRVLRSWGNTHEVNFGISW
ncbi:MAG: hypothetical protein HQL23_04305 [Candidatus Omnitrophica bacterium]|nr:hypothetical protein [Candidatus Omnitrophota bacterium]